MKIHDQIKATVSLRAAAEGLGVRWDRHKTRPARGDYWGPCPFHTEKTASFHVLEPHGTDGFFHCFGCRSGGSIIDFTMAAFQIDTAAAIRRLSAHAGLGNDSDAARIKELARRRAKSAASVKRAARRSAEAGHRFAREMWRAAAPAGDLVRSYLSARGVDLAALGGVPRSIRFIVAADHREGGTVTHRGPAMITGIGTTGKLLGVHRTWITATARARHTDGRVIDKQWLGRTGALMGRSAPLAPPSARVVVGEGIETTLAAYAALTAAGRLGWSAEAALSRGALTGPVREASQLWTPRAGVRDVLLLGEGSAKDPQRARDLYHGAADRLRAMGLNVTLRVPGGRWDIDSDFADIAAGDFEKSFK